MLKKHTSNSIATAQIRGSSDFPDIHGEVIFRQTQKGTLVSAEIHGLPYEDKCNSGVFAFHIHSGTSCSGNSADPFANALTHYNPNNCPHPYHAGDLLPLLGNHGYAYMSVLTDRFTLNEILGRVIVIHRNVDDFTSQPAGNSGTKIACGKIIGR